MTDSQLLNINHASNGAIYGENMERSESKFFIKIVTSDFKNVVSSLGDGAVLYSHTLPTTIQNSTFDGNKSLVGSGGAIYLECHLKEAC
jgi:predicted outer membrane repeat protein